MDLAGPWVLDEAPLADARIRHALFDFDGTLSLLREGWQEVMIANMLQALGEVKGRDRSQLATEAADYVEASAGELTLEQMRWLARWVSGYGKRARSPEEYKTDYTAGLREIVDRRLRRIEVGELAADHFLVPGSADLLSSLRVRGIRMSLASGTDHEDVLREARALGVDGYFGDDLFGATDVHADGGNDLHGKERIVAMLVERHGLEPGELLVVGDGPVEMRCAVAARAIALGVASDERRQSGWDPAKVRRLREAGAHVVVADLSDTARLAALLGL